MYNWKHADIIFGDIILGQISRSDAEYKNRDRTNTYGFLEISKRFCFCFCLLLHSESLVRVFRDNKVLNPTSHLK